MLRVTGTVSAVRRLPLVVRSQLPLSAIASRRAYTDGAFGKKERAEEEVYARTKEAEQIKQLREALAKKEREVDDLKKAKQSAGAAKK
ncbi:hypothetical protein BGW38_004663 [Lunasporangiospora selenospora]|uniref:ATPase inhibitor, mitochondrial n=1 Tax=Lunasporangiospora selenospora TaxID=979761 RepID=A0A9P6KC07_9FUNG|nr:hypothetical protein BGW38_004663 [Lunasporangiospora selenospora]